MSEEYIPSVVSDPRDTIRELAGEQREKLRAIHVECPEEFHHYLINKRMPITEAIAEHLEKRLGASKDFWIARDKHWQEYLSKLDAATPSIPPMYIIYENPSDYPGMFVVRRHVGLIPDARPLIVTDTLGKARLMLFGEAPEASYNLGRFIDDDPKIVEVWI